MLANGYRVSPLRPWPVLRLSADGQTFIRVKWTFHGARMEHKTAAGWSPIPEGLDAYAELEKSVDSASNQD